MDRARRQTRRLRRLKDSPTALIDRGLVSAKLAFAPACRAGDTFCPVTIGMLSRSALGVVVGPN
jgi:hypothetical protein